MTIARIVCDSNDYVAHRVLLGLRPGVGIGSSSTVTDLVIANNLNYRSVFYQPLPTGAFAGRPLTALNNARAICAQIQGWQPTDTVGQRLSDVANIASSVAGAASAHDWQAYAAILPAGMTLEELRDFLRADTDEQQETLINALFERLNLPLPAASVLPPRVRVMTMHGAKGLSAKIVFIPGLEEEILPGPWRQPYPGLVLEAARLLYVAITRARASCIISYAGTRLVHGAFQWHTASRFVAHLSGAFSARAAGLAAAEVQHIATEIANL
jgi:superfamily I DNA/RNA helicase